MLQPEWKTSAGDLGTYPSNELLNIQLSAVPQFPANQVFYKVLAGSLPPGLSITLLGNVTGTPTNVSFDSTNTFTIRATDNENNIRDRTFSLTISGSNSPKLTTLPGSIITTVDSVYINYKLQYTNPISSNVITAVVSSGSLPPGLYLTDDGVIKGYPDLPKLPDNSPTTKTHTFSIQLKSDLGSDLKVYSITIRNQQTNSPPNVRIPVILNRKPLSEPISTTDPYYDYYLLNGRTIPTIRANEYFSFKIIGRDFDTNEIVYQFGGLPPGLVGDSVTGWITGIPVMNGRGISQYEVNVSVAKKRATALVSAHEIYYMTVSNEITEDITWVTDSDLGTILNGTTNALSIKATSMLPLSYKVISGSLPRNLELDTIGEIIGKVSQQPLERVLNEGEITEYNFVVEAYSPSYPIFKKQKSFTLKVEQYYSTPFETIYLKAAPNIAGKKLINSLLTNTNLIPTEHVYRPNDLYYGKAKDVRIVQSYGVKVSTLLEYNTAVQQNHYWRKITLGSIETAIATDNNGTILYEVVYSKVIDDLSNSSGISVTNKLFWPRPINLRLNAHTINNTDILTSSNSISTTSTPSTVNYLYPASLENMRNESNKVLTQNSDSRLLPKWMTTQQANSNTLGFVQAWIICYTKPGKAVIVKDLIDTKWGHKLNEIDLTIDRYYIDRSSSYNWNTNLAVPAWTGLPSSTPVPDPIDKYDFSVLFPRKTILPDNSQ
jgi:hypothetical protein